LKGPHLLDTSALLAHCTEEPGFEIVEELLGAQPDSVFVSAITWLEFQLRLVELIPVSSQRAEVLAIYEELMTRTLPVTREVAGLAFDLRRRVPVRIPNAGALIAATARSVNAVLVHRDPHMGAIPTRLVKQLVLPGRQAAL
jgi:predicted nucleic acid-binding protein